MQVAQVISSNGVEIEITEELCYMRFVANSHLTLLEAENIQKLAGYPPINHGLWGHEHTQDEAGEIDCTWWYCRKKINSVSVEYLETKFETQGEKQIVRFLVTSRKPFNEWKARQVQRLLGCTKKNAKPNDLQVVRMTKTVWYASWWALALKHCDPAQLVDQGSTS